MKLLFGFITKIFLIFILGMGCMTTTKKNDDLIIAPKAEKSPYALKKFDTLRTDNYFWLKERTNPKVINYLKQENEYTEKSLKEANPLQEKIFNEMKSRVIENESSAPYVKGTFQYQARFEAGKQYLIFERENLKSQKKEILLDLNQEAQGSSFFECAGPVMSQDQAMMAYAYDQIGRRFYNIKIQDLSKQNKVPVIIENTTGNIVWSADNNYLFYTKQHPETLRSYQVYRFDIAKNKSTLIYEEKDETFSVFLYENLAQKYVFFISASTLTTEVHFVKSDKPLDEFKTFLKRKRGHEYEVYDGGDRFFIKSNDQATNFKLYEASLNNIHKEQWKEVLPHQEDTLLENIIPFKDFLVIFEKNEGLDKIKIFDRRNNSSKYVKFNDSTYTVEPGNQSDFGSSKFRYVFESMRQPEQTIDYHVETDTPELIKERKIPGYNPDLYTSERVWITARDGKRVPVSILNSKNHKDKQPMLIYAYGSYGNSMTPWFSQTTFSLIDRGFIFAIAHIRGGSELGRAWYENGRTDKKLNTFYDFIDVTEYFSKQSHVDAKNIFAMGGSAGGLLMGAITNLRPDLYQGIVAQVPFVDVLTTMLDDSIPLTTGEYDEWGNPNEKHFYDYISKYSPYDNISAKKYPHILATTGLHDSQVQYWEPAKWVAKLRDYNQGHSLILLKTDMEAGHGGASGRYEQLKEKAFEFSFILSVLNKSKD